MFLSHSDEKPARIARLTACSVAISCPAGGVLKYRNPRIAAFSVRHSHPVRGAQAVA